MFQWLKQLVTREPMMRGTSISGLTEFEPDPVQRFPADTHYGSNPWLFTCTKQVAQAGASLSNSIEVVDQNKVALPATDPAVAFLREPSPDMMPGYVFWLFMFSWAVLKGDAYAYMNFGPTGDLMSEAPGGVPPTELIPLPASKVKPLEDAENPFRKVLGYRFSTDKATVDINASRIFHVRDFSPVSWYQGTGAGEAANTPLTLDSWAQRWNISGFRHGGSFMRILFLVKYALQNKKLKERTRLELEEQFGGSANAHKPILVDAETDARPFGNTHQDMEFPDMRRMNRDEIAAAVGVPPGRIGILEHSNFANMEAQDLVFWDGTMKPILRLMASYGSMVLLPMFGRRGFAMIFDTKEIRVLRENIERMTTTLSTMIQYGMATPNQTIEILRAQGVTQLATYPDGDEHYVNNGLVPVKDKNEEVELEQMMEQDRAAREAEANAAIDSVLTDVENSANMNGGTGRE
jgi:HK97 family phage portal protein